MREDCGRRDVLHGLAGATAVAAGMIGPKAAARAANHPVLPIISSFSYWDHHWYVWLRGDTTYEAVEVMSRDRGTGMPPLVWVFFTERTPPKRQVHFINDQRVAASRGWQFRDIAFSMSGPPGGSQGLSVALRGLNDQPVSIDIERNAGAALSANGGGLTNQIGHSGDAMVLLFYRERAALSQRARVTIDGIEVSQPRPGAEYAAPFEAAYSSNILVGGFPFTDWRMTFDPTASSTPAVPRFVNAAGRWAATLANHTTIELDAAGDGDLKAYIHRDGDHQLAVRFEPVIPPTERLTAGFEGKFAVSLDRFGDLVGGKLRARPATGGVVFNWTFETPNWLRGRILQATMVDDGRVDTRLSLRAIGTRS
ncbi:MAG: hypothetical protein ACXWK3_12500 [Reyranella sp.]